MAVLVRLLRPGLLVGKPGHEPIAEVGKRREGDEQLDRGELGLVRGSTMSGQVYQGRSMKQKH